jgi:hypothetical protein
VPNSWPVLHLCVERLERQGTLQTRAADCVRWLASG